MARFLDENVKYKKRCNLCNRLVEYNHNEICMEQAYNGGSPYTEWFVKCPDDDCNRKGGYILHDHQYGHSNNRDDNKL